MFRTNAAGWTLLCGVAIVAGAGPVQAATYKVLHQFEGGTGDGLWPDSALVDIGGTFFGTTHLGGTANVGTVFSLNKKTHAVAVLYSFQGLANGDGETPLNVINVGGILYGVTSGGSSTNCSIISNGCGIVFSLDPTTDAYNIVYSFQGGSDGEVPQGLIDVGGTLYGTTTFGGSASLGTIFSLNPATGVETVVYSFPGGTANGGLPTGGLINIGHTLYGTTNGCGQQNCGAVFSFNLSTHTETALHVFPQSPDDGSDPASGLLNLGGILYGMTTNGGSAGLGAIYSLDLATGAEQVVYSFQGGTDGANPYAGLINVGGLLYGTTNKGGVSSRCSAGFGTVFSLDPTTAAEQVIYALPSGNKGIYPQTTLINVGGTFYGTTTTSGNGCKNEIGAGTAFSLKP
jgi:uncharacterized repeat protein (TIGR03803 family)